MVDGCVGLEKCVVEMIKSLFEARNAAHSLMVELYECEGDREKAIEVEGLMEDVDLMAVWVGEQFEWITNVEDVELKDMMEVMGIIE